MEVQNSRAWIEYRGHVLMVISNYKKAIMIKNEDNKDNKDNKKEKSILVQSINIPGGAVSIYDNNDECTALRELFEETYDTKKGSMLPFKYSDIHWSGSLVGMNRDHKFIMKIHKYRLNAMNISLKKRKFNNKETCGLVWIPLSKLITSAMKDSLVSHSGQKYFLNVFAKEAIVISSYVPQD